MKATYWPCLGVQLGPAGAGDIKRTFGPAAPWPRSSKAGGRRSAWRDGRAAVPVNGGAILERPAERVSLTDVTGDLPAAVPRVSVIQAGSWSGTACWR